MLRAGPRAGGGLHLVAAEAIDLPFRDASFGCVTAAFVLSHFTRYETALFDMVRVLKPGGRLAVATWGALEDEYHVAWRELIEALIPHEVLEDALRKAMPWEERFRDPANLDEDLRRAGLRPVSVERREYRFVWDRDDYVTSRETAASGRFARDMLGEESWQAFRRRARETFAQRFPERFTDFRDVLLAVGTKPSQR
jgi:SAM-dependent methyltransferase